MQCISMDGASANRSYTKLLFPRDHQYLSINVYDVENRFAVIQDIKQCIKKIRNSAESTSECDKYSSGRYHILEDKNSTLGPVGEGIPLQYQVWIMTASKTHQRSYLPDQFP